MGNLRSNDFCPRLLPRDVLSVHRSHWLVVIDQVNEYYKSCPSCTNALDNVTFKLIFKWDGEAPWPDTENTQFGITERRIGKNDPFGAQSNCFGCRRSYRKDNPSSGISESEAAAGRPWHYGKWIKGKFERI